MQGPFLGPISGRPNSANRTGAPAAAFDAYSTRFYRRDIQGIRAVSVFLIMAYHFWFAKISGGVDAFFVISGFLMGTVLLSTAAAKGSINPFRFYARLALRLVPAAYFVVLATVVLTLLLIPPPMWKFGVLEFIATSLFVENWELARTSTEYLARDNPPSQFQQFWALALLVQFYFLLPFLMLAALLVAKLSRRPALAAVPIVVVTLGSLAWSLHATEAYPPPAYFMTSTRLWEPLVGVLVAFAYPAFASSRNRLASRFAYTGAFGGLLLFGLVTPASAHFPGWIAGVPVLLIVLMILAGAGDGGGRLADLLGKPSLVRVGEMSFTLYLWHWPILVSVQHATGTTDLGVVASLFVMGLALVAAWLTNRFIERPFLALREKSGVWVTLLSVMCAMGCFAAIGVAAYQTLVKVADQDTAVVGERTSLTHLQERIDIPFSTFVTSNLDRPEAISRCVGGVVCQFGDPEALRTIALVGNSHAAHWQPAFDWIAKKRGFRLVTLVIHPNPLAEIDRIRPDVVVTNASMTTGGGKGETVPEQFSELWIELARRDIAILAIRDTPRFTQYQNACVWKHRENAGACALRRSVALAAVSPASSMEAQVDGLHTVDLSDLFCTPEACPAVHDNRLMYYDRHHFTNTYITHVAPSVLRMIDGQVGGLLG